MAAWLNQALKEVFGSDDIANNRNNLLTSKPYNRHGLQFLHGPNEILKIKKVKYKNDSLRK